jgi:hypothetical protein
MLSWEDIETNAVDFAAKWKNSAGNEKQQAQTFEKDLMGIFGVDWHDGLHEHPVINSEGRQNYIDYLLPGKILIEMKSKGESLIRAYNQGYDYVKCLKPDEYPELLLVSDFEWIQVTNLKTMQTFKQYKLKDLKKHVRMLGGLAGYDSAVTFKTDIEVNTDASYKMAKLHDALKANGYTGKNLEVYLVRLLFCLFGEDTGIFEQKAFEHYLQHSREDGSDLSGRLTDLFNTLNTPDNQRMTNLPEELKKFRYINGGIFADNLPSAYFDGKMRQIMLDCCDFDWGYISPAIFGSMFQGVMDDFERRALGAHYTSEENILKLIKPLFLDALWDEFERSKRTREELESFHDKIAGLTFLDPACGCGNFLIITYRELRLLEFELLKMIYDNKQLTLINLLCKVSVEQFYGIEYEEFPCQIAQVGLLLMKHQMDKQVSHYFGLNMIDFPIKETAHIVHGNALTLDWEDVVSKDVLDYIVGNPPFVGAALMSKEQKNQLLLTFEGIKNAGVLDYVTAWYYKAAQMMVRTLIRGAFVSTNSIAQGEQVSYIWKPIMENFNVHIDFAYRTFKWNNEAKGNAAVHCVIIGFSGVFNPHLIIFDGDETEQADNINPYLVNAPTVFVESHSKALCDVPTIYKGSIPVDGGNLIIEAKDYNDFIKKEPNSKEYIKPLLGSKEFINKLERWCLWIPNIEPSKLKKMPRVMQRVEAVRNFRLASKKKATQKYADYPTRFMEIRQPMAEYILIPRVSSERRKYIPIGFVSPDIISSDGNMVIPNANLYHFGILTSNVHNAWMRTVAGRLKSDYRYSGNIVYNNFPWPETTPDQQARIETAAKLVLDARSNYPDSSLADLYDPLSMPPDLLKAHKKLDTEVCKAYGTIWKKEEDCVADLMKMYVNLTKNN